MKYRSEIDGLRAIAVVPVILFHAGFQTFSGGFVGVDVFFVISGYLITTIIATELDEGRFSLRRFYERRARRILPALSLVLACSIIAAWFLLLPGEMADFAASAGATAVFLSNFYFLSQISYFGSDTDLHPLIHMWSLAVEEQFYLLFPPLMMALWRKWRRAALLVTALLLLASLGAAEVGWRIEPERSYFHSITRFWEILVGAGLALWQIRRPIHVGAGLANLLSGAGLAAIAVAIFALNEATPFPGFYALLPTLGAAAILAFAVPGTLVHRLLSLRAMVGIGLVSYSLYLWHQPVLAFWRQYALLQPTQWQMGLAALSTLPLAVLTYHFVEQPVRRNRSLGRARVFGASACALAAMLAFGVAGQIRDGFPNRFSAAELQYLDYRNGDTSGCHEALDAAAVAAGERCRLGHGEGRARVAFMGDSHTARMADALGDALDARALAGDSFSWGWCAPVAHFTTDNRKKDHCVAPVSAAVAAVEGDADIDTVVLFAQWANYTRGYRWPETLPSRYRFSASDDFDFDGATPAGNPAQFEAALDHTLSRLQAAGKQVIVVLPTPEFEFAVPAFMSQLAARGLPFADYYLPEADYADRSGEARAIIERVAGAHGAALVDARAIFCDGGRCRFDDGEGTALFEDSNHVTYRGATLIADRIFALIP